MNSNQTGFLSANAKSIAAIVGLITIGLTFYGGINGLNAWEYRINRIEESQSTLESTMIELRTEMRNLNNNINELNITLREVQVRQENR